MRFLRKVKKVIEFISLAISLVSAVVTFSKPLVRAYKEYQANKKIDKSRE